MFEFDEAINNIIVIGTKWTDAEKLCSRGKITIREKMVKIVGFNSELYNILDTAVKTDYIKDAEIAVIHKLIRFVQNRDI